MHAMGNVLCPWTMCRHLARRMASAWEFASTRLVCAARAACAAHHGTLG